MNPDETDICNCGKRGCLEQYASATGIVRLAEKLLKETNEPSRMRVQSKLTARIICDLARDGDKLSGEILDECSDYLGRAMSYVACAVDPEVFLIGGGMSKAGAVLLDRIRRSYEKYAFHVSIDTPIKG